MATPGRVFNSFHNALRTESVTGTASSGSVNIDSATAFSNVLYQVSVKSATGSTTFACDITEKTSGVRWAQRSGITGQWAVFEPKFACGGNNGEDNLRVAITSASADELFTVKIWYY